MKGEILGKHNGLYNYTIGQRKNVGLSGDEKRHYVCGKNVEKNILYVAFGSHNEYLISTECILESVNLISTVKPTFCTAKFRYRGNDYPVQLEYLDNGEMKVLYPEGIKEESSVKTNNNKEIAKISSKKRAHSRKKLKQNTKNLLMEHRGGYDLEKDDD